MIRMFDLRLAIRDRFAAALANAERACEILCDVLLTPSASARSPKRLICLDPIACPLMATIGTSAPIVLSCRRFLKPNTGAVAGGGYQRDTINSALSDR